MQWLDHARWDVSWTELRPIKGGGQGDAKHARRLSDGREAFLKILNRDKDAERRARFFREAMAYSMFDTPGIPALAESNAHLHRELNHPLYLATEWIDGPTLGNRVAQSGPLPLDDAWSMASSLLNTLSACHELDVVHRDIKPDNVILRRAVPARPVLLDFGLTYHEQGDSDFQTEHGQEIGNRFLRLPELSAYSPSKQDARSDLTFIAGLLLYAITGHHPGVLVDGAGRLPHQREPILELIRSAAGRRTSYLLNFLDRAFQHKLSDRFLSAAEMATALEGVMTRAPDSPFSNDDLAAIRAMIDTASSRREREAVKRFSDILRFVKRVHNDLIAAVDDTLQLSETGFDVNGERGQYTLMFKRFGETTPFLSTTFLVVQAGDELAVTGGGEPIFRTEAANPKLGDSAETAIRAFLARRLRSAIEDTSHLPPEAEILECLVSRTLPEAATRARAEGKPIFAIYYDPREPDRGALRYGLEQYFGNRKTRVTLASGFVVAVVPMQEVGTTAPQLSGLSMEQARWAIFSPLLELREHDVLNRNAGDGEKMLAVLADRYRLRP